jgi:hypothetical protein
VAASGSDVVVSAPGINAVYVPHGMRDEWRRLTGEHDLIGFGDDIAIDGSTLWVGAPGARGEAGVVVEYQRGGNNDWMRTGEFQRTGAQDSDHFGHGLAISDGFGIVGVAGYDDTDADNAGAAVIFELGGAVCTSDGACVCVDENRQSPCRRGR